jgi:hypothetical protein
LCGPFLCAVGAYGVGAVGAVGAYGGRYGRGAGNRSLGAGNGPLDGFFSGQALDRQNSQDRAHGPEKGLVFDCCPDATPAGKVIAVREK